MHAALISRVFSSVEVRLDRNDSPREDANDAESNCSDTILLSPRQIQLLFLSSKMEGRNVPLFDVF